MEMLASCVKAEERRASEETVVTENNILLYQWVNVPTMVQVDRGQPDIFINSTKTGLNSINPSICYRLTVIKELYRSSTLP